MNNFVAETGRHGNMERISNNFIPINIQPLTGPLIPCEPPSPAPSRRGGYQGEERGTMNRAPSTADISQYECNEDGAIRLHMVSNMILLISSLIMIGTGKS